MSNPKEATQWKHILYLAQKFIFCSEWRNFSRNASTSRILERNRIVGLPIPKRKIPTGTKRYLKHWSCTVFEEMYGIRRKMTKREMGLFCVFFFFFWETVGLGLCSCLLFWFGFGLCYACDIEEDGRGKSWSSFYKEGEGVSGRNSY